MEQSVTTGARGLRSRSKRPRSRIAELTRRASTTSDLVEGRWAHLLIDPFLACVTATKTSGTGWGESLLRQDSPHCVPCAMCQPRGSLRGLAPSCTRRRVRCQRPHSCGLRSDPKSRRTDGGTLSAHPFSVGKRGVRYPFVPKAGRCRRRWVSSTQSFESRSARVPR